MPFGCGLGRAKTIYYMGPKTLQGREITPNTWFFGLTIHTHTHPFNGPFSGDYTGEPVLER